MSGSPKPDRIKPIIDLLVEQHQNGAPDGVIRLTGRLIQGETIRDAVEGLQPLITAAKEMRACWGLANHSLYLMKSGVEMEKAIETFDAALAAVVASAPTTKAEA